MNSSLDSIDPLIQTLPEGGVPWHFDDSGYYSYLLITAEEPVRREVLERLRASRFGTTTGPSLRPANNRIQYSHYIRVTKSAISGRVKFEEVEKVLLSALGPSAKAPSVALRPVPRIVLPHKVPPIQRELASWGTDEVILLRQDLKKVTEDRDLYRSLLDLQSNESEIEHLRDEIISLRHRIQELSAENEVLGSDLFRAQENTREITEWINARVADEAAPGEILEFQSVDQPETRDTLLQVALKQLLRRVELHPGAFSQLENEIERPESVISILAALNNGDEVNWDKSLKGAPGWMEKKFTKHKKLDGRLYGILRKDASIPWFVYLSDKHNQRTDIARLRELY